MPKQRKTWSVAKHIQAQLFQVSDAQSSCFWLRVLRETVPRPCKHSRSSTFAAENSHQVSACISQIYIDSTWSTVLPAIVWFPDVKMIFNLWVHFLVDIWRFPQPWERRPENHYKREGNCDLTMTENTSSIFTSFPLKHPSSRLAITWGTQQVMIPACLLMLSLCIFESTWNPVVQNLIFQISHYARTINPGPIPHVWTNPFSWHLSSPSLLL